MENYINSLSRRLSENGLSIEFKDRSVFKLLRDTNPNPEDFSFLGNKIAIHIFNDINKYKNIYNPYLEFYNEQINKEVTKIANMNNIPYDVSTIGLPEIIRVMEDRNYIDSVRKTNISVSGQKVKILTNLSGYKPSFGSAVLDKMYKDLNVELSDEERDNVLAALKNKLGTKDSYVFKISANIKNINTILYALGMVEMIMVGNIDYIGSENAFKIATAELRNYLKNKLTIILETYETDRKTNRLVIGLENDILFVNEDVYFEFIKNNTSEVLLGLIVELRDENDVSKYYLKNITDNADYYIEKWKRNLKLITANKLISDAENYRNAYLNVAYEVYDSLTDELKIYVRSYVMDGISSYLKELSLKELVNVEDISSYIVAVYLLNDKDYYDFIEKMELYSKNLPGLDVDDVASLASIDKIVDYIVEQIDLVKG